MPGIGFGELAVIFLLLLIFVGPKRLPQAARTFGRLMGEVRRATDELKTALYIEEARQRRTDPYPPERGARVDGTRLGRAGRNRDIERPDATPDTGTGTDDPTTADASTGASTSASTSTSTDTNTATDHGSRHTDTATATDHGSRITATATATDHGSRHTNPAPGSPSPDPDPESTP